MPDIRLVRPRGSYVWIIIGALVAVSLMVLVVSMFTGDPTEAAKTRQVGASANFGAERAPVIPVIPTSFGEVAALSEDDLGLLVHVTGVAESRLVGNSVWVRTSDGRRILVRLEPPPPRETRISIFPGSTVSLNGYVQKIAQAELKVVLDTLGISLPRPTEKPGGKFGDLPDAGFLRVDSLFVKNFYISVRPESLPGAARESAATEGR